MLTPLTKFPMPITTPRLILRPPILSTKEINEYQKAIVESIDTIKLWLPWAKQVPTLKQIELYIKMCNENWITKKNNDIGLPIWLIDQKSKVFIGNIVIWNIVWNVPKFEFGFWVRNSQTRKGYMKEAIYALSRYCFSTLGVNRIEIKCETNNLAAQMIPKSLGYKLEGILVKNARAIANNALTDTALFALTNLDDLIKME